MTNVILRKFFLFLPSNIMKASGAMRLLECSQRNSLSSEVFSPGYANTKKIVSYCLKVKVFLQLSDAGEISELTNPATRSYGRLRGTAQCPPSVVHQTFWSGERWSTRFNCSYFLRYVTNIRDWRYYPTICLLFPAAEQEPTLINCGYWQDKKIFFTQVRRILFTVGSLDRSIGRYCGRYSGR